MNNRACATKTYLRHEIAELRRVGGLMSNLCFNLGQSYDPRLNPLEEVDHLRNFTAEAMADLRRQWDAIKRAEAK